MLSSVYNLIYFSLLIKITQEIFTLSSVMHVCSKKALPESHVPWVIISDLPMVG